MTPLKEIQSDLQDSFSKKGNGIVSDNPMSELSNLENGKESSLGGDLGIRDLKRRKTGSKSGHERVKLDSTMDSNTSNAMHSINTTNTNTVGEKTNGELEITPTDSVKNTMKWMEMGKMYKQFGKEKLENDVSAAYNFAACLCYMFHLSENASHVIYYSL